MNTQKHASEEPTGQKNTRDGGGVRAVTRATRIVTALAEHPFPLGIVELATFVQLSPASVHRILATLISAGWVEQNSRTAKYRLGMRVTGVGTVGLATNPVVHDGRMYLSRLAEWSGHDAVLSTLVGVKTVQLARVAGPNTEMIEYEAGRPQPAHAMADGKLLLSYLSAEEARYYFQVEGLREYTANTMTDPAQLEQELAQIQRQGYAVDNGERFEKGRGIAVPVLGSDDRAFAAILCLGKLDPDRDLDLVRQMKALAGEMSDRLAASGDLPEAGGDRLPTLS